MEKLNLINSLDVVDFDGDADSPYYVIVENSPEARKVLKLTGVPDVNKYLKQFGSSIYETDTEFDLSHAAFEFAGATRFDGDKFV